MISSRGMSWTEHVACMGERRDACRVLVGKPEGKRPLGRHKCRWEDDIKMDLREMEWACMNWIYPAQDRNQWQIMKYFL
jgi:hypothetical protein